MSPRADAGGVAFARAPRTPSGRAHQPGLKKSVRAASVHARRREAEGELAHRQVHGSDTARPVLCSVSAARPPWCQRGQACSQPLSLCFRKQAHRRPVALLPADGRLEGAVTEAPLHPGQLTVLVGVVLPGPSPVALVTGTSPPPPRAPGPSNPFCSFYY